MLPAAKSPAELQSQRNKLSNSYNALLEEFSSKDLRSVGNYTLGRLIGKGSFGKVYLATHRLTNGSKVVLKSTQKDDSNLAREIHHHRQFHHPHIARLYEVIVTESTVWLVLEYCPGDELYHYLTHHGPIEPEKVQKIFSQLVGAVAYVHSKSCVHRDLKLENILLDKNENVKLCDFGFTREYEGKASYLQTWCGTVCYSAPEMLKGEKYAGEKVDVWSLGIILYALLCGELPFDEDDDNATKAKILKDEPSYPESMPTPAKELIISLLSKRPLLRPGLADILTSPWLADHAPQQQAILKLQQPAPFSTQLEKDTLQRMRGAGVDIDAVIENVLSQRCDSLAGWWALLLEKEERKERRRQRRRKEKEADQRASRRISTASGRLLAATIKEAEEERGLGIDGGSDDSVFESSKDTQRAISAATPPPLSKVPEDRSAPDLRSPSTERRAQRQSDTSRRRSLLGAGDQAKRSSTVQVITTNADLLAVDASVKKRKRRYPAPFLSQLASIKHWFKESAKRAKSPSAKNGDSSYPNIMESRNPNDLRRVSSEQYRRNPGVSGHSEQKGGAGYQGKPHVSTHLSNGSIRKASHSPSPITPQSSYRRGGSANLRGRKSTSSSVSSIRSFHAQQQPSHSKASSASSNSVASPSTSAKSVPLAARRGSPQTSVKVLAAPADSPLSPGVVRTGRPAFLNLSDSKATNANTSAGPFSSAGPPSPGIIFTKRKRTPFKGPMLGPGLRRRSDGGGTGAVRSSSAQGRASGEMIEEIQEEEEEEEDVEEVDSFSPGGLHDEFADDPLHDDEPVVGSPLRK